VNAVPFPSLARWTCAILLAVATPGARAQAEFYGRLNLALEHRSLPAGSQTVVADNASRIGFIETERIAPGLAAGVHLEMGFDGSTGAAGNGFDRGAELFIGSPNLKLSLGRFGSTAYLAIPDVVSMHNHDTGISSDALFAHVEPLGRKAGVTMNAAAWTLQLVGWAADPLAGHGAGTAAMLAYDKGGLSLAASAGQDARRYEHSARMMWSLGEIDLAAYVEKDRNVYGAGTRMARRGAVAWRVGAAEWHLNVASASAYSGGLAGERSARQGTIGYNYNLSKRTKWYALATRLRDHGRLYGNWTSVAIGLRQNF
jgi:predicted porin